MKIPHEIISLFEKESEHILFGEVRLVLKLRDGRPHFSVIKEQSFQISEENDVPQLK